MNSITTFAATALVLFAIGQGIAAVRADEVPSTMLHTGPGVVETDAAMLQRGLKPAADHAVSAGSTSK